MIMRTTQKEMMSKPVTSADECRKKRSSCVCCGQPSVEWHHSADENQVSRTSSSCLSALADLPAFFAASSALRATKTCPASDRKSTRLNSSHRCISYAVFCLKKKKTK